MMDKDRFYFKNGSLFANSDHQVTTVLINSEADLDNPELIARLEPGSIAHTPGYAKRYELSPTKEWIECTGLGNGSGSGSGSSVVINGDEDVVFEGMSAAERVASGG